MTGANCLLCGHKTLGLRFVILYTKEPFEGGYLAPVVRSQQMEMYPLHPFQRGPYAANVHSGSSVAGN